MGGCADLAALERLAAREEYEAEHYHSDKADKRLADMDAANLRRAIGEIEEAREALQAIYNEAAVYGGGFGKWVCDQIPTSFVRLEPIPSTAMGDNRT